MDSSSWQDGAHNYVEAPLTLKLTSHWLDCGHPLTLRFRFHEFHLQICLFSLVFILICSLLSVEFSQNTHTPSQLFFFFTLNLPHGTTCICLRRLDESLHCFCFLQVFSKIWFSVSLNVANYSLCYLMNPPFQMLCVYRARKLSIVNKSTTAQSINVVALLVCNLLIY